MRLAFLVSHFSSFTFFSSSPTCPDPRKLFRNLLKTFSQSLRRLRGRGGPGVLSLFGSVIDSIFSSSPLIFTCKHDELLLTEIQHQEPYAAEFGTPGITLPEHCASAKRWSLVMLMEQDARRGSPRPCCQATVTTTTKVVGLPGWRKTTAP